MYSYVKCKGLRITGRMALIKVRMYSLLKYGFLNSKGVTDVLCEACDQLGWAKPTKIQIEAIPLALQGRDIIGLAETGSGKTGAFALPILNALLETPQRLFALVLTPTRELAFQISEQFEALGSSIGVQCAVIVGGIDSMSQSLALAKKTTYSNSYSWPTD